MHDDAVLLKHKLEQDGVEVTLNQYDGYPHFFHILSQLHASQKFMADLAEVIREKCAA